MHINFAGQYASTSTFVATCAHTLDIGNGLGLGTHLFVKVFLDQETANWPFRSSRQVATCYYQSNHTHQ